MAFSTNSGSGGFSAEINVTPLIDVLLVLLIIFMVIVPVMPHGLNSALPAADQTGSVKSVVGAVMVRVERSDAVVRYVVDGVGVDRGDLQVKLMEALARRPERQMLVRADAELDYGVVAGVIDAGEAAGAVGIGIVTPGSETPHLPGFKLE
ncbi:MAG: biopolymer transporter ExbD [Edaphobacter sp.]